jgi:hypothetical protein
MPNTLNLDDDLDPIEAVVGIEQAFAIKISDEEAAACETVGDIYDLLSSHFAAQLGTGGACISSMAFYRLRKALRRAHPDGTFRTSTSLAQYTRGNARSFLHALGQETKLRVPAPNGRWLTAVGCITILAAFIAIAIAVITEAPAFLLAAVACFIGGLTLAYLDPGELPDDCQSLGGLTEKVSALNFGKLAGAGGAVRAASLWDAMTEVLSAWSDLPQEQMRRDTLLLQVQLQKARA